MRLILTGAESLAGIRAVWPGRASRAAAACPAEVAGVVLASDTEVATIAPSTTAAAAAPAARFAALGSRLGRPCRAGLPIFVVSSCLGAEFKNLPGAGSAPGYAATLASHRT